MRYRSCFAAMVVAFVVAIVPAQGRHRGPDDPPSPARPAPRADLRSPALQPDPRAGWECWWLLHEDEFAAVPPVALTQHLQDEVVRALHKALGTANDKYVTTSCLFALARIGVDPPAATLHDVLAARLRDQDAVVSSVAALALGLAASGRADHRTAAVEGLGRLVRDGSTGERTRACALLGLGLCARSADLLLQRRVFAAMQHVLATDTDTGSDSRVGAVLALGLLDVGVATPAQRELRDEAVQVLVECWNAARTPQNEIVQAHCPTAIARLLDRDEPQAEAWRERFLHELVAKGGPVRAVDLRAQSCAIALGMLVRAEAASESVDRDCSHELTYVRRDHADEMVRRFAEIALARIGGTEVVQHLRDAFTKGRATDRQWIGLALAVHEAQRGRLGAAASPETVALLRAELERARAPETVGAVATALSLVEAPCIGTLLLARLPDPSGPQHEAMVGYLCRALARPPETESVAQIRAVLAASVRRPLLERQAALALVELGAADVPALVRRLAETGLVDSACRSGLALAIGRSRDARAVAPLLQLLGDPEQGTLVRMYAASALGGLADPRTVPWSVAITTALNHCAAPPWLLGDGLFSVLRLP